MAKKIVISSGHSKFVAGAIGYLNEVTEARRVVSKVAENLKNLGCKVVEHHDNTTKNKTDNVNSIVKFHNSQDRDLDVSVHFNASKTTDKPVGVEVLYYSDENKGIAEKVSKAIADASGLKNRGAKQRTNIGFVKRTKKPSILIEVCFVDSKVDAEIYKARFDNICKAIAESIAGEKMVDKATTPAKNTSNDNKSKVYRFLTGTFNSESQAKQGLEKIKETGVIKVGYVNKDGDKWRVLSGTFKDKDTVEKAIAKVKKDCGYIAYLKEE